MPLERQTLRISSAIGEIRTNVIDSTGAIEKARLEVHIDVLDQNGVLLKTVGPTDILVELTATQRNGAWNLAQAIRTKATAELLPQ